MNRQIKAFIMDVDGTITDGKIYMGCNGEIFKAFDVKDGYAIHEMLPERGVKTVILTGRTSDIVSRRAEELEIDIVLQGIKDKASVMSDIKEKLGVTSDEIAYIGDDMADYEAMSICGLKACPNDAVRQIRNLCDYVSTSKAGFGAIREIAEWMIANGYC